MPTGAAALMPPRLVLQQLWFRQESTAFPFPLALGHTCARSLVSLPAVSGTVLLPGPAWVPAWCALGAVGLHPAGAWLLLVFESDVPHPAVSLHESFLCNTYSPPSSVSIDEQFPGCGTRSPVWRTGGRGRAWPLYRQRAAPNLAPLPITDCDTQHPLSAPA